MSSLCASEQQSAIDLMALIVAEPKKWQTAAVSLQSDPSSTDSGVAQMSMGVSLPSLVKLNRCCHRIAPFELQLELQRHFLFNIVLLHGTACRR